MCDKQTYRPEWANDERTYNAFKCPKCGYPQFCGCPSCKDDIPNGMFPYRWKYEDLPEGKTLELIVCANCNFEGSPDFWLDEEGKQYKDKSTEK